MKARSKLLRIKENRSEHVGSRQASLPSCLPDCQEQWAVVEGGGASACYLGPEGCLESAWGTLICTHSPRVQVRTKAQDASPFVLTFSQLLST